VNQICIETARKHLVDCRTGISGDVRGLADMQKAVEARLVALRPLAPEFIDGIGTVVSAETLNELRAEYETLLAFSRESDDFLGRFDITSN
jgi:hypothetical protein